MLQLDKRLMLMASYMTPGGYGVDVGTDHGYLAVFLVQSGMAKRMLATDIRSGPLSSAQRCIREAGLTDQIETRLTEGLNGLDLTGVTDILIAGMGGILISEILSARLSDLSDKNLILQPMTQSAALRSWLGANGFAILSEKCATVAGKSYSVIHARFTGEIHSCTPFEALVGKAKEDQSPDADTYLSALLHREEKALRGLCMAQQPDLSEIEQLKEQISRLQALIHQREERKS